MFETKNWNFLENTLKTSFLDKICKWAIRKMNLYVYLFLRWHLPWRKTVQGPGKRMKGISLDPFFKSGNSRNCWSLHSRHHRKMHIHYTALHLIFSLGCTLTSKYSHPQDQPNWTRLKPSVPQRPTTCRPRNRDFIYSPKYSTSPNFRLISFKSTSVLERISSSSFKSIKCTLNSYFALLHVIFITFSSDNHVVTFRSIIAVTWSYFVTKLEARYFIYMMEKCYCQLLSGKINFYLI